MPTIGRYEILEQLGSGSMGTVYKGRDTVLDRMVAIKTIRPGVNVELEAKERFLREARTCARLTHPHIVAVFDLGEESGTSFIAMELLEGSDFRQLIERREPLTIPVKLTAMAQVCEALAYAHRAGIIHRDIKPSNLFLSSDGRAKVVDFGIAKLPTSHLTREGAVLGTPNYMAPEQIKGLPCDGRADLFSAAIVFFEFLTFTHPFKSQLVSSSSLPPLMEIPRRIIEEEPYSLLEQDPGLPVILQKIFAKALAKDPNNRYATGDDFAADLRVVTDAITQNSSPTFSRVELPSNSSFAVPPPIAHPEPVVPKGPAMLDTPHPEPQEWRVIRMQKLIPAFEAHAAAKDIVAARNSLTEMQSVAGDDARFREPVEHCRTRLSELERAQSVETVGKLRCAKCANVNRADAVFCVGCGASLVQPAQATQAGAAPVKQATTATAVAPPQPVSKPAAVSPRQPFPKTQSVPAAPPLPEVTTQQQSTASAETSFKPATKTAEVARTKSDRNKLVAVIGSVAAAALLLIIAPMFFRTTPVKEEKAVASAVVPQQSQMLATAKDGGKVLATLERGTRVNVLTMPASFTQGWARVQARSGSKFLEPGFLKTASLAEWDSRDSDTALALARLSGPMEAGSDAEIRSQEEKLKAVAAEFTEKPAAGSANLDIARLEFTLLKRAKEADPMAAGLPVSLADLITRVVDLGKDPSLQSGSEDLLRQIHDLVPGTGSVPPVEPGKSGSEKPLDAGPVPVPQIPPETLSDAEVQHYMAAARQLLGEYRYTEALAQVRRILKSQPQNSNAKALQKKILEQKKAEDLVK